MYLEYILNIKNGKETDVCMARELRETWNFL